MNWTVLLLTLLAAGAVFGAGRSGGHGDPPGIMRFMHCSRERLRLMLRRVERSEAPEYVMGAMCYEPVALPDRADYLCPVCGERTVYGFDQAQLIQYDLPAMRRLAAEMEGNGLVEASLEETFCGFCHPGDVPRDVVLAMTYPEGDTVRTPVCLLDLQVLSGFLSGGLSFTDSYDATLPLREHADRLRVMLGIE